MAMQVNYSRQQIAIYSSRKWYE